jgi:hypothetical protein
MDNSFKKNEGRCVSCLDEELCVCVFQRQASIKIISGFLALLKVQVFKLTDTGIGNENYSLRMRYVHGW